jgi:hypothetical protein
VNKFQTKFNFKFQNPFDQLRKKIQKTAMKLIETMNKKKREPDECCVESRDPGMLVGSKSTYMHVLQ